jgi:hypothetical protein
MHRITTQRNGVGLAAATAFGLALASALVAALAVGRVPAAGAASAAQYQYFSFVGTWTATEPDTTVDTLKVSGGNGSRVNVTYDEPVAGLCNGGPLSAKGQGTVVGTTLTASVTASCKTKPKKSGPYTLTFVANGDGTISGGGLVWHRQ